MILFLLILSPLFSPDRLIKNFFSGYSQPLVAREYQDAPEYFHRGLVIDMSGSPIPGAKVSLYGIKNTNIITFFPVVTEHILDVETDPNGLFFIPDKDITYEGIRRYFLIVYQEDKGLAWLPFEYITPDPEEAIRLDTSSHLEGVVVDEQGNPVENVTLHALLFLRKKLQIRYSVDSVLPRAVGGTEYLTTITDSLGRFTFNRIPPWATAEFVVLHEDYVNTSTWKEGENLDKGRYESGANDIVLTLRPRAFITGTVVDKISGKPLPNIMVSASGMDKKSGERIRLSDISDSSGHFIMSHFPGEYTINVENSVLGDLPPNAQNTTRYHYYYYPIGIKDTSLLARDFERMDPIWQTHPFKVSVRAGEIEKIVVEAFEGSTLEIAVLDNHTHKPVNQVFVELISKGNSPRHRGTTQNDQSLLFYLPSGSYQITKASKKDYFPVDFPKTVNVKPQENKKMVITLSHSTTQKIVVFDEAGNTLSDIEVVLIPGNGTVWLTDTHGQIEVDKEEFEPNETLDINQFGQKIEPSLVAYDAQRNLGGMVRIPYNVPVIKMTLQKGFSISGRVIDRHNMALTGAKIELALIEPFTDTSPIGHILTDHQGRFEFYGLLPDQSYRVSATASDYNKAGTTIAGAREIVYPTRKSSRNRIPIPTYAYRRPAREEQELTEALELNDLVLRQSNLSLSGIFLDERGNRVSGVVVKLSGESQQTHPLVRSNPEGHFSFHGLGPGNVELEIDTMEVKRNIDTMGKITVKAGSENVQIVLFPHKPTHSRPKENLDHGGLLECVFIDEHSDKLLKNIYVCFRGKAMANDVTMYSDDQGRIEVVLPEGIYRVDAYSGQNYEGKTVKVPGELHAGQKKTLTIKLKSKPRINGIILDLDHHPVGKAKLRMAPHGSLMATDMFEYVTEADGRFDFAWNYHQMMMDSFDRKRGAYLMITQSRRNLAATFKMESPLVENFEVTLESAPIIQGVITMPDGTPVPNARISYELEDAVSNIPWDDTNYIANTKGEYKLQGLPVLPDGYKYLFTFMNNGWQRHTSVTLLADETYPGGTTIVNVVLGRGRK